MSPPLADRSTNLQMQTQTSRGQQNLHKSLLDRQLADRDGYVNLANNPQKPSDLPQQIQQALRQPIRRHPQSSKPEVGESEAEADREAVSLS